MCNAKPLHGITVGTPLVGAQIVGVKIASARAPAKGAPTTTAGVGINSPTPEITTLQYEGHF